MKIEIVITGNREVQNKIKRLGSSLYQLKPAMTEIGQQAGEYYSGRAFDSRGGVFGKKWAALKPATQRHKANYFRAFTNVPLVRHASGGMRDSFNYTATQTQVIVGNKKSYFKYHQSSAPRTKIPRRQMMGINEPVKRMVKDAIRAEVRRKINAA